MLGVVTALLSADDAGTIITGITENLAANLPFIVALVGFGIIGGYVMHKIKKPMGK